MTKPGWTLFPRFHADYMGAERSSGQFLRFHVPAVIVLAAIFWIPAVERASGVSPLVVSSLLAVQLAQGAVFNFTRLSIRWPLHYGVFAVTTNHLVAVGLIAFTFDPRSPLWGIYPAYPLLASMAITISIYFTALLVLSPLAIACTWAAIGAVPLESSLGPALLTALVTTLVYLLISSAYQGTRDERARQLEELAKKDERTRIADELHGSLGAALTEISLWHDIATHAGGDTARDAIVRAAMRTRGAMTSLRACVGALAREPLDALALEQVLRASAGELCRASAVELRFRFHGPAGPVDALIAYHVSKLVEEATVNAIRHSSASSLAITVELAPAIVIEIEDDGAGFDPEAASGGHGMSSLRAHARALGRELRIISSPEAGTRVGLEPPPA